MNAESENQSLHSSGFHVDRPKDHPDQDCLGRSNFAENLASKIAAWKQQDSLVIGLEGAWGSGKSSIKNFILYYLGEESGISTVEFNPWQFSGDDRLFEEFAGAIASVLPSSGPGAAERKQLWAKYSSYIAFGGKFTETLKLAASFAGIPGATILLDQTTRALDALGELTKQGGETMSGDPKSLQSIKGKLSDAFRKLEQPVLVVLDDIDRLTDEEVALIFRLVKANADFPNLVYLLLYDRKYVEESLNKITSSNGAEFLQKIVQMPIPVPAPQIQRVHKETFGCIDRILKSLPGSPVSEWNEERWANLWVKGLSHYFTDLRRVYRYANSCAFLLDNLKSNNCLEIDVMDFLGLEVLRIFEKPVYDRIKTSGSLLTGIQNNDWDKDQLDDLLNNLLNCACKKKPVEEILSTLFLKAKSKWDKMSYDDSFIRDATAKMRVCSPEHFQKYFQIALPEGTLSQSLVVEILQNLNAREVLRKIFDDAIRMEFIVPLLQALDHHDAIDKQENPLPYLLALCDAADSFPETHVPIAGGMINVDPSQYVMWAVLRSCDRRSNAEEKVQLLERVILDSEGLYMPADLLWTWQSRTKKPEETMRLPALDQERDDRLRGHMVARFTEWAQSGRLIKHPLRGSLINLWIRWQSAQCRKWFGSQLENIETARPLIASHLSQQSSQVVGSVYKRKHEYFDFEWMEKLASWDEWKFAIERVVAHDPNSEFSQRIKSALEQAEKRKAKGLTSNERVYDDD